jgi:hypothetical protein
VVSIAAAPVGLGDARRLGQVEHYDTLTARNSRLAVGDTLTVRVRRFERAAGATVQEIQLPYQRAMRVLDALNGSRRTRLPISPIAGSAARCARVRLCCSVPSIFCDGSERRCAALVCADPRVAAGRRTSLSTHLQQQFQENSPPNSFWQYSAFRVLPLQSQRCM